MLNPTFINPGVPGPDYSWLRRLTWTYFWLLIFEGALRKWVIPGLSNQLLVVRDPVLILLYVLAMSKGVFPGNGFVLATVALGVTTFAASLLTDPGHFAVALFGFHADFLHLPLIFLIPKIWTIEDIKKIGFWTLVVMLPMAFLIVLQFRLPADSIINEGSQHTAVQIEAGLGKIRPPGTFSFTSGCVQFLTLSAALLLYALIKRQVYPRWLVSAAAPCILLSVALSGSRSSLGAMTVLIIGLCLICFLKPKFVGGSINVILTVAVGYFLVASWSVFSEGVDVLNYRVGGEIKSSIVDRYLGGLTAPFDVVSITPALGFGLGRGTNAGAVLMGKQGSFMLAEDELPRIVMESGPILGFSYILLRLAIIGYLGFVAFAALGRENPLPVLLFFYVTPLMLTGQFGQPTTLGFAVIGAGLCLAAARDAEETEPELGLIEAASETLRRGRSPYAEHLHTGYPA